MFDPFSQQGAGELNVLKSDICKAPYLHYLIATPASARFTG
ncbi:hypothetical protein ACVME5_006014 [Bradyrhizobium liaoningense]